MLHDRLNWRYATKKMDPSKAVPAEKVEAIIEAARLAPTSSGLQPFEVIVVSNPDVRAKLQEAANGQAQITEGSHVLVFAAWDDYTNARIDEVVADLAQARGGVSDGMKGYFDQLKASYVGRDKQTNFEHAARQAYIGFAMALAAAAFEHVDSTPMEGFDPAKVDDILGLKKLGLRSVTLLPLGYRDETGDWLVNQPKVRRPVAKFSRKVA
jgi:nitroreductase/dihydropteridine reductase